MLKNMHSQEANGTLNEMSCSNEKGELSSSFALLITSVVWRDCHIPCEEIGRFEFQIGFLILHS